MNMNETDLIAPNGVHDEDARLFGGRNEQAEDHFVADLQNKIKITVGIGNLTIQNPDFMKVGFQWPTIQKPEKWLI